MSYWNAVYLLAHLLLLHETCLSVCIYLNPREIEKHMWPVCFVNNKWTPCPDKLVSYHRHARVVSTDSRSKRHAFQLPLSFSIPVGLPYLVKQSLKLPVSMATGMLNPILGFQPNNRELMRYNNNILNQYYNKPHVADFPYMTHEKVTTYPTPDISHNIFPVTTDITDYYKKFLQSFHESSTISPVTSPTLNRVSDFNTVSENVDQQTTNFESNSEKTQTPIYSVTGEGSRPSYGPNTKITEEMTTATAAIDQTAERKKIQLKQFAVALEQLDRVFYYTTFEKLLSISPPERAENGISFVQSGLFLSLLLMVLSSAADAQTAMEIDKCLGVSATNEDKTDIINEIVKTLPKPTDDLRWRWSSRLVVGPNSTDKMANNSVAEALRMQVAQCNETEPEALANALNRMVQEDSGGAIRDTFETEELLDGFRAAAITTLYFRARWRSAPTVLNGTRPFRDEAGSPTRTMRMIRINDIMRYSHMDDWGCQESGPRPFMDASGSPTRTMDMIRINDMMRVAHMDEWGCQAIEISYATPGLTLLILVPDKTSLRDLAKRLTSAGVPEVARRLQPIRVAVSMPLYTLRMTLLLPSKLQSMGINRVVDWNNTDSNLRLSHAVQRIMFWAEPGRNAFKDDGIEWDKTPELELVVDRPYLFFVRWHNLTLMNGNFVL